MPFVIKNRIKETTTVEGVVAANLLGAPSSYQRFSNLGNGNTTFYAIAHQTLNEWEVGTGTYLSGSNSLSRDVIKESSNANTAVNFSAGTKDIMCVYPAGDVVYLGGPLGTPASGDLINCVNAPVTSKIQPVTASLSSGAMIVTLNPTVLDFRSVTLTSGSIVTRTITSPVSLTVPSGATLGTISSVKSKILIIAIDNSGSVELAVINSANNRYFDETGLLNTTAMSSGANSAIVAYSAASRTGKAYRVVGYVESTQTTAGTWAQAISAIQGVGGQAFQSMSSIGFGPITDVLANRVSGVTYRNTTGRPLFVIVFGTYSANSVIVNGITLATSGVTTSFIVPIGGTYVVTQTNITYWTEY